jgi:hypothetical protein
MKQRITELIKKVLTEQPKKKKCDCGCDNCTETPILNEYKQYAMPISEHMRHHLINQLPIHDNTFRPGSEAHVNLIHETRLLWKNGVIELQGEDKMLFETTDLGRFGMYEDKMVPLDYPMVEIETLTEAELEEEKKQPPIGKPKRGGSKKFYVYVKNPKTGKVKKVSFGQAGMSAKLNNPKARKAFAARHKCAQKTDRTKASYWSCRLPRYAKLLGFKTTFSGFW